ncbi:hypothetical protein AVEN_189430-1, partial [Araneus ventricosus]
MAANCQRCRDAAQFRNPA